MDLQIAGQVTVVVGGARGLGLAIARAFANEGASVALLDRADSTPEVAKELSNSTLGIVADVTDFAAVRGAADAIRARFGRVDHLAFAAGIGSGQFGFPFWEVDVERWERVLRVNLVGAAHVAHAFAPGMAEAGRGSILFLASVAGQVGSQTDPPYSASKAGLINFAQCAAKDLAPFGVRVNSLCPGMIRSDLNRSVYEGWAARQARSPGSADPVVPTYEEWGTSKVQTLVPLRRWQTPEDVADMAVFLASARAHNVTGQAINVDGGYVMHW